MSFRVVTRRALDYTLTKAGLSVSELQSEALVDEWDRLQPWPEAVSILNQVRARGYQVGLLSNGDHAMLTKLIGTLPVTVHHIFSSEQAGYYKPHPAVYQLPLQALTLKPAQVLHVAGSPTDVLGTKAAGLPCYWSNRSNDILVDPAVRADYVFDNLAGLLELL